MRNTPLIVMGVLLIVLGVAAFLSRELIDGKRDLVVEVGSITVTADTQKKVPLSPILGGIGLVCGAVLIAVGSRKS